MYLHVLTSKSFKLSKSKEGSDGAASIISKLCRPCLHSPVIYTWQFGYNMMWPLFWNNQSQQEADQCGFFLSRCRLLEIMPADGQNGLLIVLFCSTIGQYLLIKKSQKSADQSVNLYSELKSTVSYLSSCDSQRIVPQSRLPLWRQLPRRWKWPHLCVMAVDLLKEEKHFISLLVNIHNYPSAKRSN